MVNRDQHAFDRRQQVNAAALALYRAKLLSLTYPAIEAGQLDGINLAEKVSGEGVDSDASVLVAFVQHPGMTGMEAVALRDFEAGLLHHDWRSEPLGRRHRKCIRRLLRAAKVHDSKNEKKCKQNK